MINDDESFLWNDWPMKDVYALFHAGTIVRGSLNCKSPTPHKQGLNLGKIWVLTFLNEVVQ